MSKKPQRVIAIISPGGSTELLVLDLIEDFKSDFDYFIAEARRLSPKGESQLAHKRFLRAAHTSLFMYAEAVLNSWLQELRPEKASEKIGWMRLDLKMNEIQRIVLKSNPKKSPFDAGKKLRNELVHFQMKNELAVFSKLSLDFVEKCHQSFDQWALLIEAASSLERFSDTEGLLKHLSASHPKTSVVSANARTVGEIGAKTVGLE